MIQVELPAHESNRAYPSLAVDVDYEDGLLRGRKGTSVVHSQSGTAKGAAFFQSERWFVQGTTLYENNVSRATGLNGDRYWFVPLGNKLLCCGSDQILICDGAGNTATKVVKPATPTGITVGHLDRVVDNDVVENRVGCTGTTLPVTITADPWSCDTREVLWSSTELHEFGDFVRINGVRIPSGCSVRCTVLAKKSGADSYIPLKSFTLSPGDNLLDMSGVDRAARVIIGYRFEGIGVASGSFDHQQLTYLLGELGELRYKIVRYSDATYKFESDAFSPAPISEDYVRQFPGSRQLLIPSAGSWRAYRPDAAGVYRLALEFTTAGSETVYDNSHIDFLGDRYWPAVYPTQATVAMHWQGRAVIAHGTSVFVSEIGRLAWEDDADVLELPTDSVIALADIEGKLYLGTASGWYWLQGYPGNWTLQLAVDEPAEAGYAGTEGLATVSGRLYSWGSGAYDANLEQWRETKRFSSGRVLISPTAVYIERGGSMCKWSVASASVWQGPSGIEAQTSAGIVRFDGARVDWSVTAPVLWAERRNVSDVYADGSGTLNGSVNGTAFAATAMPGHIDRRRWEGWEAILQLSGSGSASVKRILIDAEKLSRR